MKTSKISVIIPVYNEEDEIEACLQSLVDQTLDRDLFEVILVDNGSTDKTVELARMFSSKLNLTIHQLPRKNISIARNVGASLAYGYILVFLDADCIPKPTWLASGITLKPESGIWGAHYLIPEDSTWVGSVWAKYQAVSVSGESRFIPGSGLFIGSRDFKLVLGFNESVQTSEDVELCARIRAAGMTVTSYPELSVVHYGTPRTLRHFYLQNKWHGKDVLPNFIANLPSLENLLVVGLSLYTLFMFFALIVVSIWKMNALYSSLTLAFLVFPALLLSARKVLPSVFSDLAKLSVLYTTYALARAFAVPSIIYRKLS